MQALPFALAGAQGALSFAQARENNQAARRARDIQKKQNEIAADQQREKAAKDLQLFEGALRTTSAARGAAGSSSATTALSAFNTALTSQNNINLQTTFANSAADAQAAAAYQAPGLGGLYGALQGFQTGLNLRGAFKQ